MKRKGFYKKHKYRIEYITSLDYDNYNWKTIYNPKEVQPIKKSKCLIKM